MKKLAFTALSAFSFAALAVAPAMAGTVTESLDVTASVDPNCIFTTPGTVTLSFGSYDPVVTNKTGNLDQSTTFGVTCTNGASVQIGLSGANASREMASTATPANKLNYQLYRNAARDQEWGTIASGNVLGITGTGLDQTQTVYGRIPGGQNPVVANDYTATETITVSF